MSAAEKQNPLGELPLPITSATVIRGATTNRVKLRVKRGTPKPKRVHGETSAQRATKRYRADPSIRGKLYVVICISLPVEDLVEFDAAAERARMSRSAFLRHAAKKLLSEAKP